MDLGLKGRKALVLGASGGLGAAIAKALAAEGASVVGAARSVERIESLGAGLDLAGSIAAARLDLADRASVDELLRRTAAEGGVDILVNNSGGPAPGEAKSVPADQWSAAFESMVGNIIHLNQGLLPFMVERKWGRIVTLASSGIEAPIPRLALSNGLRMALVGWSKTLAAEVAADGVTVNVVVPGRIHTDRVDELDAAAAKRQSVDVEAVRKASMATIPAGRYGKPQEMADMVAFLASERASYVTGAKIRVDGGMIRSI
jgi:3-oxoacyl-[acyl-carrier protein] reductase